MGWFGFFINCAGFLKNGRVLVIVLVMVNQIICAPLVPGMGAGWGFIVNALTPSGESDVVF